MLYIKNLTKKYPGFELDATLEVQPGRITGLIGENGSGKTTLFKAILGLIHKDGGQAALFGKPVEKLRSEDRSRIGAVLADSGFSAYITIRDAGRILKGLYPSFREDWFREQAENPSRRSILYHPAFRRVVVILIAASLALAGIVSAFFSALWA
jgi:ABC-2 type transport system ATP-binding protein